MNSSINNQSNILNEIIKSYKKGNLIPFIGAGFPKNIDDFPDWDEFVNKDLAEDLKAGDAKLSEIFGDNISATEYYVYKVGEQKAKKVEINPPLSKILDEGKKALASKLNLKFSSIKFDSNSKDDKEKWEVYIKFISLRFNVIYTTNWDPTLESCDILPDDEKYSVVITGEKLREYLSDNKKRLIIKYHGDYEHSETIVATMSDYFQRLMHRNILDLKFQHDLLHYDFLFLGFSFKDIFIRYILYQINYMIREVPSQYCPKIFVISSGKPNEFLSEYYGINRIRTYNICQTNRCAALERANNKTCRLSNRNCKIKSFFSGFFDKLKNREE